MSKQKEYDLGIGQLGNGLTVWNRAEEVDGDYKTVAHVGGYPDFTLELYDSNMPNAFKQQILDMASSYQQQVMAERASADPQRLNYKRLSEIAPAIMWAGYKNLEMRSAESGRQISFQSDTYGHIRMFESQKIAADDVRASPFFILDADHASHTLSARVYEDEITGESFCVDNDDSPAVRAELSQRLDEAASRWFSDLRQEEFCPVEARVSVPGDNLTVKYGEDGSICGIESANGRSDTVLQYATENVPELSPNLVAAINGQLNGPEW